MRTRLTKKRIVVTITNTSAVFLAPASARLIISTHRNISRRIWLKGMAVFSAAAGMPLILASTAAEAKASKAAVHYQDYPSGMRMCHMCKFYISSGGRRSGMIGGGMMGRGMMRGGMMGAGARQLVEGRISPMGYRDLYAPL
jgi:hypothetical protein